MYDTDELIIFCDKQASRIQNALDKMNYDKKEYMRPWRVNAVKVFLDFVMDETLEKYSVDIKKHALEVTILSSVAVIERHAISVAHELSQRAMKERIPLASNHLNAKSIVENCRGRLSSFDEIYSFLDQKQQKTNDLNVASQHTKPAKP